MLLKKIYLSNKAHSTIQHMFTKEKKIPGQKVGGGGGAGAPLANPKIHPCSPKPMPPPTQDVVIKIQFYLLLIPHPFPLN